VKKSTIFCGDNQPQRERVRAQTVASSGKSSEGNILTIDASISIFESDFVIKMVLEFSL
jgi:hypothetical protein